MKRKIAAVLTTLAIAAGLLVATAAPANATVHWNCAEGVGCIWQGANGTGTKATLSIGQYGVNQCWNITSGNDTTSSASADYGSGYDLVLYRDANCVNGFWTFNVQAIYSSNKESYGGEPFNDTASSFKIFVAPQ